ATLFQRLHDSRGSAPNPGARLYFFFQAEDGIRDRNVTGVQTCALPISSLKASQMASNWTYSTPCPTISPPMRSGRYKSRIEKGVNTYAIRRDHKNSY